MNNIPERILNECRKYAKRFAKEECCAIIKKEGDDLVFQPCENTHPDKTNFFTINPEEFIYNHVVCVFHSHYNCGARPSSMDKESSTELCIPFLIYSLLYDDFYLYRNISV